MNIGRLISPPICHCAVLNFNSRPLVFVKVIYSSLLLVTSDHHRTDDASHLWVNKLPSKAWGTLFLQKKFIQIKWCAAISCIGLKMLFSQLHHVSQLFRLFPCLIVCLLRTQCFLVFCLQSFITLWEFIEKFCQSYCDWINLCGHFSYFSCWVIRTWLLLFDLSADLRPNRIWIPPKVLKNEATAQFNSEQYGTVPELLVIWKVYLVLLALNITCLNALKVLESHKFLLLDN